MTSAKEDTMQATQTTAKKPERFLPIPKARSAESNKMIQAEVPEPVFEVFKELCDREDVTMRSVILSGVLDWIHEIDPKRAERLKALLE